jgi:hypothetical protein
MLAILCLYLWKIIDQVWSLSQLGQYLRTTYDAETEVRAFHGIKQAVVSTLLIAEPWLRKAFRQLFQADNNQTLYQCQHCFQLLSMELLLNESFHAVVVEVNGQPSFSGLSDVTAMLPAMHCTVFIMLC